MHQHIKEYSKKLSRALELSAMGQVPALAEALREAWRSGHTKYLCGNGGSAGNAVHLANDLLYGAGVSNGIGLRIESLSANTAILTCLAVARRPRIAASFPAIRPCEIAPFWPAHDAYCRHPQGS